MLRNTIRLCDALHVANPLLNEVLSLNAQELVVGRLGLTVWPSSMKS